MSYHPSKTWYEEKPCEECGRKYPRRPYDGDHHWRSRRYCSTACAGRAAAKRAAQPPKETADGER